MAERLEIIVTATDKASGVLSGITGKLGGLGGIAKGALIGGLGLAVTGATAALGGLTAGLGVSISEAMEAEEVMAQLNAVLKSTGGAAGVTADMASDLATSMSQVTRFNDEAILSGENMLLTFTNIGENVFPQATQTMLDMSQALGQDVQSSAMQLGKALNDPINGVTALRRVGVNFTEDQQKTIKAMVETGQAALAQKLILFELRKEFGGSAEAAGGTLAGQLDILKNTMSNVAEEVGTVLLPILTDGLKALAPLLIGLATSIADFLSSEGFKAWLASTAEFIVNVLVPGLQMVWDWLAKYLPPAIATVADFWQNKLIPAVKAFWTFIQPVVEWLRTAFTVTIPAAVAKLRAGWDADFGGIRTMFEGFVRHIKLVFSLFKAAFEGDWRKFGEILRQIVDNAWNTLKTVLDKWIKIAFNVVKSLFTKIKEIDWLEVGRNIVEGIANGIEAAKDWAIAAIIGVGQGILDAIKGFLGIQSPSSVMASQVGAQMAAGIRQGLIGGLDSLTASATAHIMPVVQGLSAPFGAASPAYAMAGASGGINVVVQYSPMVSFADEYELERRLKPVIERAMRRR